MSKVITPHFENLIDRFIASGRYNNKSEVIRAGLRLLEEHIQHVYRRAIGRKSLAASLSINGGDPARMAILQR